MSLHFELGDADQPRGHAILYARLAGGGERYAATYCVVLPISFSIGKFLPPILGGQLPLEELGATGGGGPIPIPPMLEDVESAESLRQLAERRGDDLCDLGVLRISDDSQRLTFAAEAATEYGAAYARYQERWPSEPRLGPTAEDASPLTDEDARDVVTSLLPERDRLRELAQLIGQSRYAMETQDKGQFAEIADRMRRVAATLPDKYRASQLTAAALRTDPEGAQLADLYLQRAYKLLDEDYSSIPPIEQRIKELRGTDSTGSV